MVMKMTGSGSRSSGCRVGEMIASEKKVDKVTVREQEGRKEKLGKKKREAVGCLGRGFVGDLGKV